MIDGKKKNKFQACVLCIESRFREQVNSQIKIYLLRLLNKQTMEKNLDIFVWREKNLNSFLLDSGNRSWVKSMEEFLDIDVEDTIAIAIVIKSRGSHKWTVSITSAFSVQILICFSLFSIFFILYAIKLVDFYLYFSLKIGRNCC